MKTKIKLYGKLKKIYGESFEFANIKTPMDVVKAMNTLFPGFRDYVVSEAKAGGHYEIIVDGESKNVLELNQKSPKIQEVQITPCLIGNGFAAIVIAIGVVAVAVGLAVTSTALAAFFITLGVGLIIAGIMYLLTPIPENEPQEQNIKASIKNSSFLFQNPRNVSTQGRAIPIIYGRLKVGSYVVGTSVVNYPLHLDLQLQRRFIANRANALLKIQESFGSSFSELYKI